MSPSESTSVCALHPEFPLSLALSPADLVVERQGVYAAFRRSHALVKGHWKALLVALATFAALRAMGPIAARYGRIARVGRECAGAGAVGADGVGHLEFLFEIGSPLVKFTLLHEM